MKKITMLLAALLIAALCLGSAFAMEGVYQWRDYSVEVTKVDTNPMLVPSGIGDDEYAVAVYITADESLWKDSDLCSQMYGEAVLADAEGNAYKPGAMMTGTDKPFLIFTFCVPKTVDSADLTLALGEAAPAAE